MKLARSASLAALAAMAQASLSTWNTSHPDPTTTRVDTWTTSTMLSLTTMTESGDGDVKTHTFTNTIATVVPVDTGSHHSLSTTFVLISTSTGMDTAGTTWNTDCTSNKVSDCPTSATDAQSATTSSSRPHDHNTPPVGHLHTTTVIDWYTVTVTEKPSKTSFETTNEGITTTSTSGYTSDVSNSESIILTTSIWPTKSNSTKSHTTHKTHESHKTHSTSSCSYSGTWECDPMTRTWTLPFTPTTTWTIPITSETPPSPLSTISSALLGDPTAAGDSMESPTSLNMTRTHPSSLHYNSWTAPGDGGVTVPGHQRPTLHTSLNTTSDPTYSILPLPITMNGTVTSVQWFPETGKPKPTTMSHDKGPNQLSSYNSSIIKTLPPGPTSMPDMWSSVHFPPPPGTANATGPHITIPLTILTTLTFPVDATSDPVDSLHPTPPFGTEISAHPPWITVSSLGPDGHLTVPTVSARTRNSTDCTPNITTPTGHIPTPIIGPTDDMNSLTHHLTRPTQAPSTLRTVVKRG